MAELLFCCCAFSAPPAQLYAAVEQALLTERRFGGSPQDVRPGERVCVDHAASGGMLEAFVEARGEGSLLTITLFAEALDRPALDALSRQAYDLFDALAQEMAKAPEHLVPEAWPSVHAAPGTPPRVLRRADYPWKTARYSDAPEDTMGESASLTRPLGVTQFGADVLQMQPGERNCRSHVEFHEQEGFLVLSGTCHVEVEGEVVVLEAGDFCVTFPGEEHFLFNASDAVCEVLAFGGPNLSGSGSTYPKAWDMGWRERLQGHFAR